MVLLKQKLNTYFPFGLQAFRARFDIEPLICQLATPALQVERDDAHGIVGSQ
jgi:hypothetical protein